MLRKEDIELPPGLKFGETCNPDGKNNYCDPNNPKRPIFMLNVMTDEEKANSLEFKKIESTFG